MTTQRKMISNAVIEKAHKNEANYKIAHAIKKNLHNLFGSSFYFRVEVTETAAEAWDVEISTTQEITEERRQHVRFYLLGVQAGRA